MELFHPTVWGRFSSQKWSWLVQYFLDILFTDIHKGTHTDMRITINLAQRSWVGVWQTIWKVPLRITRSILFLQNIWYTWDPRIDESEPTLQLYVWNNDRVWGKSSLKMFLNTPLPNISQKAKNTWRNAICIITGTKVSSVVTLQMLSHAFLLLVHEFYYPSLLRMFPCC